MVRNLEILWLKCTTCTGIGWAMAGIWSCLGPHLCRSHLNESCRRERRGQQLLHEEGETLRTAGRLQLGEGVLPRTLEGQEGLLAAIQWLWLKSKLASSSVHCISVASCFCWVRLATKPTKWTAMAKASNWCKWTYNLQVCWKVKFNIGSNCVN